MHKVKVIFNPIANRGGNAHIADDLRERAQQLGGAAWVNTNAPSHAIQLAAQAAQEGYERVIAMGGDGTVHEVVNGLMQIQANERPALGIVPIGSGNDFVRGARATLGPLRALEACMRAFGDGTHARTMDVAFVRIDGRPARYWGNVLGIGFDAAVTLQSQRIKRVRGTAMYFLAAIRTIIENYDAPHMVLDIDGEKISQRVQMLTIGNGTREGGGFITTPDSKIDDGLLDYAMFKPVSRAMMIRLIPEVMRGTHGRFHQVRMGTLKSLRLRADQALMIHTDGEMLATYGDNIRDVEVGIVPGALRLVS